MRLIVCLSTMLVAAWITGIAPAVAQTEVPRWDADAAARYLDSRMEIWWSKAKELTTGDGSVRCLSCHTSVPYALARPALRRLSGETTPTAHEDRILETARLRVRNAERLQPYYDTTEEKKAGVARRRVRPERAGARGPRCR
jgi:squalene-hopene/tetraprenyl-beta-curcumene cyclase